MPAATPRRPAPLARGAQWVTAAALAIGCLAYAANGPAAGSPAVAAPAGAAEPAGAAALLTRSDIPDRASRSIARTPRAAVTAPEAQAPARRSVGALGVTAVVKPKPVKKKPASVLAGGTSTAPAAGQAGDRAAAPAQSGGSASAYAAAGAGLGLVPAAAAVYSAIRSTFGITNIGGLRPGDWGDHGTGHAVDVMITSSGQGNAVAGYALANAGRFGIKYVIWQQRIWMPSTGSWKLMADRGSPTQNHMDHVHISVN